MNKIRQQMDHAKQEHQAKMEALEKELLDKRIELQKEAEIKIKSMESAAQEKAQKYLANHTKALEEDNQRMEKELRKIIMQNQNLIQRRDRIATENKELEREQKLRSDLVAMRIKKISKVTDHEKKRQLELQQVQIKEQHDIVNRVLKERGLFGVKAPMSPRLKQELQQLDIPGLSQIEEEWLNHSQTTLSSISTLSSTALTTSTLETATTTFTTSTLETTSTEAQLPTSTFIFSIPTSTPTSSTANNEDQPQTIVGLPMGLFWIIVGSATAFIFLVFAIFLCIRTKRNGADSLIDFESYSKIQQQSVNPLKNNTLTRIPEAQSRPRVQFQPPSAPTRVEQRPLSMQRPMQPAVQRPVSIQMPYQPVTLRPYAQRQFQTPQSTQPQRPSQVQRPPRHQSRPAQPTIRQLAPQLYGVSPRVAPMPNRR
ncbi:hypothetical protein EDD86DRAFT_219766 [Gorgonomyces haynaldii]|nr:hypothetical protein EDD86DRAFT_219766 [Gorgonomyces haynaldii]